MPSVWIFSFTVLKFDIKLNYMYTLYPLTSLNRIFRLLLISAYGEHNSDNIIKYDLCHMFGL